MKALSSWLFVLVIAKLRRTGQWSLTALSVNARSTPHLPVTTLLVAAVVTIWSYAHAELGDRFESFESGDPEVACTAELKGVELAR